jgi:branched-subunit amino acid transport protein
VLGLATLGWCAAKGSREPRWGWAMLAVSWLVAGPLLVARFNIDPHGLGLYVCQRFHLLPAVLLVVPVAVGFDRVAAWLGPRVTLRPLPDVLAGALALVGFAMLAGLALPRILAVHSPAMEHGVDNALAGLPDNAIVLAISEDQCFGVRYLQLVEGARPDVDFVCWTLTARDWYRERLPRVPLDPQDGSPASVAQADKLLATGRPLLVDNSQPAILAAFPHYPLGLYDRVLPRGSAAPAIRDVIAMNRDVFARFDLDEPRPSRADDFASIAHLRYALTWAALAKSAEAAGDHDAAAFARDLSNQLAPTP